jgi:peptidoglycan/LPS O-acetylase OafA/YrhL
VSTDVAPALLRHYTHVVASRENTSSSGNAVDRNHSLALVQILRGVAAMMVVFHHFCLAVAEYHPSASILARSGLGSLGAAGVDLFFVISGFIMVLTQSRTGGSLSGASAFWKKRFIRIYPLYWFWTSVLLMLWAASIALQAHHFSASYIALSYLLWPTHERMTLLHPLLDQGWTLSYEIYFYFLFGISIALGLRSMRLPFLIAAFALLAALGRLIDFPSGAGLLASNPLIIEFLLGALVGTFAPQLREWGAAHARLRRLLLGAGVAALLGSMWMGDLVYSETLIYSETVGRAILWGVPAFVIVAAASMFPRDSFRNARQLIHLGDASYSIYLTHAFATLAIGTIIRHYVFIHSVSPDLIILAGSAATVWLCALTYPLIEQPILSRFRTTEVSR